MNNFAFDRTPTHRPRAVLQVAVADNAGMVWSHSNPVELYRWISRRNELLETIAVAFRREGPASFLPATG